MGTQLPSLKRGQSHPIFGPFFIVAGWIKMPLGTEVGLGLGDSVFDRTQLPPRKKGTAPPAQLWPMSIVAKRLDG